MYVQGLETSSFTRLNAHCSGCQGWADMKSEFLPTCLHSDSKSKTRLSGEDLAMWLVHGHNIAEHNTYTQQVVVLALVLIWVLTLV